MVHTTSEDCISVVRSAARSENVGAEGLLCSEAANLLMLTPEHDTGLAEQISRYCSAVGVAPQASQTVNDIQTILTLVAVDAGVAILLFSVRRRPPEGATVTAIDHETAH